MSRRKKNRRSLLILLGVLAVLIVGLLLLKEHRNGSISEEQETSDDVRSEIFTLDSAECTSITCEHEGESLCFIRTADGWQLKGEPDFPLDESDINSMLGALEHVTAEYILSDIDDPSQFGLDKPEITITVGCADGTSHMLLVGDEYPLGSDRYIAFESDPETVYVGPNTLYTYFGGSRSEYIAEPALPAFESSDVLGVLFSVDGYPEYRLLYEQGNSMDISGVHPWIIADGEGRELLADEEELSDLFIAASSIGFESVVDYRSEKLSDYGITADSSLISILYTDKQGDKAGLSSLILRLGDQPDADCIYVNVDGTGYVYVWSVDSLQKLVIEDASAYRMSYPGQVPIRSVTELRITVGQDSMLLTFGWEDAASEEGMASEGLTMTQNGSSLTEEQKNRVLTLYTELMALRASTADAAGAIPGDTVLEVLYRTTNADFETYSLEFSTYDKSYCLVRVNNADVYFVDRRDIDALLKEITELL